MPNIDIEPADRRWRNLSEMLDRLGLDPATIAHGRLATALRSAASTCESCDRDQLCRAWLAAAPERLDKAPVFCPNAELFGCERWIAYRDVRVSERLEPDPNVFTNVIDDLCGGFGRSHAANGEGERWQALAAG